MNPLIRFREVPNRGLERDPDPRLTQICTPDEPHAANFRLKKDTPLGIGMW